MKKVRVAGMSIEVHDTDARVTGVVDTLNNLHDSGKLKSVMVVYTGDDAFGALVAGPVVHRAMLSAVATELSGALMATILGAAFGTEESDD